MADSGRKAKKYNFGSMPTKVRKAIRKYLKGEQKGNNSIEELKIPLENIAQNLEYIISLQELLSEESLYKGMTPKQKSTIQIFSYLSQIEGLFSEVVNVVIFLHLSNAGIKRA